VVTGDPGNGHFTLLRPAGEGQALLLDAGVILAPAQDRLHQRHVVVALLISDLPPPETVHGLWQKAPSGTVPTSRQLGAAWCLAMRTL
jgi:hypothetical protein